MKTGTGKRPFEFNIDYITKLEKCVGLIEEMGGGEVCMPITDQNMAVYRWKVNADGAKLVTTLADATQEYGNLIEISKFHQMHAGQPVEGFDNFGNYYEEF